MSRPSWGCYVNCPTCGGGGKVPKYNPRWLRAVREEAGVSLRQTAKAIGISPMYLSDIERGKRGLPEKVFHYYQRRYS